MALPIDQTVTLIVTEALKVSGVSNPSAADITRAGDEWLRPVLEILATKIDLPLFEETQISTLEPYESRYALPTDFDRIDEVSIFTGENFDTLQSATSSTLTLALTETITSDAIKGKLIFITSGVAVNSMTRVIGYDENTKIANVSPALTVTPSTDGYLLADKETFLDLKTESAVGSVTTSGIPTKYHIYGNTPNKEIYFDRAIKDDAKGMIKIRHSLYPHKVDLTDARMTSVYNKLMHLLQKGVLYYSLTDRDDGRTIAEFRIFESMVDDYRKRIVREKVLGMQMFKPN